MNVLRRRCGCGAIFALVHLRDRTQQCTACQRKAAASMEQEGYAIQTEWFTLEGYAIQTEWFTLGLRPCP